MTVQCCKCEAVRGRSGWERPETEALRNVTYTYCPKCLREFRRQLWRARRARRKGAYAFI